MTTDHQDRTVVHIYTDQFMITGEIAMYADNRLTDYIASAHAFIAVTNAVVHDTNRQVLYKAEFLNVQKNKIVVIMPAAMVEFA
jgi:hypothetical protein